MFRLHCYPTAAPADIFHCCQFILAYVGVVDAGGAAEAALFRIAAGVAQMPRFVGYRAAIFTSIDHGDSPLRLVICN